MPLLYIVLALASVIGSFGAVSFSSTQNQMEDSYALALSGNMRIYSASVTTFMRSNPTHRNMIFDSSLILPEWYRKDSRLAAIVNSSGHAFVYLTGEIDSAMFSDILGNPEQLGGGILGFSDGSRFHSTRQGITEYGAPKVLPRNNPVVLIPAGSY